MRQIICYLLLLPGMLFAQENNPVKAVPKLPFTLKTAPLNLINPVQLSADILADIPLKARWALEMGLGLVLDSEAHAQYTGETYTGIKIKPTIKYYLDQSTGTDTYIGLALKYNNIRNERFVRTFRQGMQYVETSTQRRQVHTWGAAFRVGTQLYGGKRHRFVIDPSFSFGVRQSRIGYVLPPDAELIQDFVLFDLSRRRGIYWTPDIMIGCSLGWAFR